jgi:hypothetical protein
MAKLPCLSAALAVLALAACTATDQPANAQGGPCSPAGAKALTGQAAPSEAEVKRLTGAAIVRRIAPGDPVTMDLNERRVTIEVDTSGKIVRASCG